MDTQDNIRAMFSAAEDIDPRAADAPRPPPEAPVEEGPTTIERCALLPLNDYGNGCRFIEHFGEDIIFAPRVGYFRWTGKVWRQDEDKLLVRSLAHKVADCILEEVQALALEPWEIDAIGAQGSAKVELAALTNKEDLTGAERLRIKALRETVELGDAARKALGTRKRAHRQHAKMAGNTASINNMLTEGQVQVAVPLEDMNTDPLAINTESGVIYFRKEACPVEAARDRYVEVWGHVLEPHKRENRISKMMPVDIDPAATCPEFLKFLTQIMPSEEMRDFIQRWFGYTLTGLTTEQKLAFFHGGGRNGKSTLVDVIARIMADYATTVPIESLTGADQRKGSDATPDLVRLPGARMVRASEPEQGQRMKEAIIKALTGGEPILIRRMQQEFVEITPEFKLTISGNHKPDIRGSDDGIWRRVLLVPFEVQIPEADVDMFLSGKLWAERAGIMNWLLDGALSYLSSGLRAPGSVIDATKVYREESDPLRFFLQTECDITGASEDFIKARDLIAGFQYWQAEAGNDPYGKRHVSTQLRQRAGTHKDPETGATFSPLKRSDTGYVGIKFKPSFEVSYALHRSGLNKGEGGDYA
jgi:putative DNA primase/helicase